LTTLYIKYLHSLMTPKMPKNALKEAG